MNGRAYQAVVIGGSAGASQALVQILAALPAGYSLPVIVAQHLHPWQKGVPVIHLCSTCTLQIQEARDKEPILPGHVYFAPPNYHLLIEDHATFALSIDARVNYTRPSIDVLFESAADVYGSHLIGVILTGANDDGARGLRLIRERGGLAVVQDPETAQSPCMPQAAIDASRPDWILPPAGIGALLARQHLEPKQPAIA